MNRRLNRLRQLGLQERFQLALEFCAMTALLIVTALSIWSKSWEHAAVFFSLSVIVVTLAEKRVIKIFSDPILESIEVKDRRESFTDLTAAPREWVFRGGSGRWFRNFAVPAVARTARAKAPIRALLVDPRDELACRNYAEYRRKSTWYSDHTIDARGIQAEVLATIFVLCRAHHDQRVLVHVSLTNAYSPIRIDANGEQMIVTTPDRQIRPLRLSSEHWMYHAFVDEINEAAIGGCVLKFPERRGSNSELSPLQIKEILSSIILTSGRTNEESRLMTQYASEADVNWDLVWQAVSASSMPNGWRIND